MSILCLLLKKKQKQKNNKKKRKIDLPTLFYFGWLPETQELFFLALLLYMLTSHIAPNPYRPQPNRPMNETISPHNRIAPQPNRPIDHIAPDQIAPQVKPDCPQNQIAPKIKIAEIHYSQWVINVYYNNVSQFSILPTQNTAFLQCIMIPKVGIILIMPSFTQCCMGIHQKKKKILINDPFKQ